MRSLVETAHEFALGLSHIGEGTSLAPIDISGRHVKFDDLEDSLVQLNGSELRLGSDEYASAPNRRFGNVRISRLHWRVLNPGLVDSE